VALFKQRNLDHFVEVLQIAEPNVLRSRGVQASPLPQQILKGRLEQMHASKHVDAHYHTFSVESYTRLMEYFAAAVKPEFSVISISRSRGGAEVVAVLKKSKIGSEAA
jgi:hypothetical protein